MSAERLDDVKQAFAQHGLTDNVHHIGSVQAGDRFVITQHGKALYSESRNTLRTVGGNHLADAAPARQPGVRRSGTSGQAG